jgi:hypothetical protein
LPKFLLDKIRNDIDNDEDELIKKIKELFNKDV